MKSLPRKPAPEDGDGSIAPKEQPAESRPKDMDWLRKTGLRLKTFEEELSGMSHSVSKILMHITHLALLGYGIWAFLQGVLAKHP